MIGYGDFPMLFTERNTSKAAILPVPCYGASTWVKGADKGSRALLDALANMEIYDIEAGTEVFKVGICTDKPVLESNSPEKMVVAVSSSTTGLLKRSSLLSLLEESIPLV